MNFRTSVFVLSCAASLACGPNVVGTGTGGGSATGGGDAATGGGTTNGGGDTGGSNGGSGGSGGGTDQNAYPSGPYGVTVNRIIQNFTLPGYFTTSDGTKVNTLQRSDGLDLQSIRTSVDSNNQPLRFLLLDISAGWCPPCNQEAQDLGNSGTKKAKIAEWLGKGGLFMTVLAEGYDESTHDAPVEANMETWINTHNTQSSLVYDPNQSLLTQGISASAFPTNLVIDLRTMKIVSAWYGLDATYQKWEAALNGQ